MQVVAKFDDRIVGAIQAFGTLVGERFDVVRTLLFGSCARGEQGAESDVDLAIILRGDAGEFWSTKLEMVEIAYDILVKTGVQIDPTPIWQSELNDPNSHPNPGSLRSLLHEGVAV